MVDFSFQPFADMLKLKELKGDNFIWIDHHFTSIDDAVRSGQTFKGTQITGKSGCELTWEYFTDEPMPDIVKMIGRYDVWDLGYHPDILPFITGLKACDLDPSNIGGFWGNLLEGDDDAFSALMHRGKVCHAHQTIDYATKCNSHSFDLEFKGMRFLACNVLGVNSLFFDSKFSHELYDAVMAFGWTNGNWTFSMYSDKPGVNLGRMAKEMGGGGHERAAGFQLDHLPFELPHKK